MLLRERVAALQARIASTPFVTATSLSYEERPPSAGFIRGTIDFVDGSKLEFKEFLITSPSVRLIKYGYHYGTGHRLIFRYDNANDPAAKHLPSFPHHKHISSGLLATDEPTLEQVLEEIVSQIKVL
jgi:hypothetical protein